MKTHSKILHVAVLSLMLVSPVLCAAQDIRSNLPILSTMRANGVLMCLAAADYDMFLKHGADQLAENTSKQTFEKLAESIGGDLKQGFELRPIGHYTRGGDHRVGGIAMHPKPGDTSEVFIKIQLKERSVLMRMSVKSATRDKPAELIKLELED